MNAILQTEPTVILQSRRRRKASSSAPDSKVCPLRSLPALVITDALEMYLTEHGDFSKRTKTDYRDHTRYLQKWASDEGLELSTMADFTPDLVREYRSYMLEDYGRQTVNIRLRTLRAFLRWAHEKGYTEDLVPNVKLVKVEDNGVRYLRDDEVQLLLSTFDHHCYEGFRDRLLFLIMLDCGVRISELLAVTWDMVDFQENIIALPGRVTKNGKPRSVPLSSIQTVPLLRRLLIQNQAKFPGQNHLFLSYLGKPLSTSSVRHSFLDYANAAGIKRLSPHMLRHTFARRYVRSRGNVFALQQILGHSTLDMTLRYVRLFSTEIAQEHQVISPVDYFLG